MNTHYQGFYIASNTRENYLHANLSGALHIELFLYVDSYMATSSDSHDSQDRSAWKRPRFTLQVPFKTKDEKEAFFSLF